MTPASLQARVRRWVPRLIALFVSCYVITTGLTVIFIPHMTTMLLDYPVLFVVPLLNVLVVANITREIHHGRVFRGFLSSCVAIVLLMVLAGIGMYPDMIYSTPMVEHSLTIYNAASSPKTHRIMLIIALIGMPIVTAYTVSVYWIFRGKVQLDEHSY